LTDDWIELISCDKINIKIYVIIMENIEIKKNKNKRSIESLIEESAIDNSFNYEAHELRKAFN